MELEEGKGKGIKKILMIREISQLMKICDFKKLKRISVNLLMGKEMEMEMEME